MNITLPSPVQHAITMLNKAGFEAYVVGGCVRDSLLETNPYDWDITTSALPEQIIAVFHERTTVLTGVEHGTVTVIIDHCPLEITTYRLDGNYSDGRHPDSVTYTHSLVEDLRRRDFTINAMAYHPLSGIIDPYDGRKDLAARQIRCVGDPHTRFTEDALRIIRALRFASTLGFAIHVDTERALKQLSHTLLSVSVERVTAEFQKLLLGHKSTNILSEYQDILCVFIPEIDDCCDFSLQSLANNTPTSRWAALFTASAISPSTAEQIMRRMRLDNKTIREVALLLACTIDRNNYPNTDIYLTHLLNHLGSTLIFTYMDLHGMDTTTVERAHTLLNDHVCYQISMLAVNGNDLISAGIPAGPQVGSKLNHLLESVMNQECPNERKALLAHL